MTPWLLLCPLCAQRPGSAATSLLLLAFIAAPFAIAALVAHAIRNVDS